MVAAQNKAFKMGVVTCYNYPVRIFLYVKVTTNELYEIRQL